MPPTKRRPGTRVRSLDSVIDHRQVQGPDGPITVEVTVIDRVVETLQAAGFLKDAAARVGVTVETLRNWRREGESALADITAGRRRRSDMNRHTKRCMELADRMATAEAEGRLGLLAVGQRLARGGHDVVEKVETTVTAADGTITTTTTTRTSTAPPDFRAASWLLSHRWPDDYNRRTFEVTGKDGGPLVDIKSPLQQLEEELARVAHNRDATTPEALEAAMDAPRKTHNGANGHHP